MPQTQVPEFLKPVLVGRSLRSLSWSFLLHYTRWGIPEVEPAYALNNNNSCLCTQFLDRAATLIPKSDSIFLDSQQHFADRCSTSSSHGGVYCDLDPKGPNLVAIPRLGLKTVLDLPEPHVSAITRDKIIRDFPMWKYMTLQLAYLSIYGNVYVAIDSVPIRAFQRSVWFIRLVNGTPESNGLHRVYWRRIPALDMGAVGHALGWMIGEYGLVVPTTPNRT